jgi:hypothetical protein
MARVSFKTVSPRGFTPQQLTDRTVPLLCHIARLDQLKVLDFLHRGRISSVAEVIDVIVDCGRECFQAV